MCKECKLSADRSYQDRNTARIRAGRQKRWAHYRNYQLQWTYGISLAKFDEMLERQGGVCAICKGPQAKPHKHFCVDHDHATGKVRGLLCTPCNKSLGCLKDDPDLIEAAARYVRGA